MEQTRQYKSALRKRQAEQTRTALLAAARALFAECGYAAASVPAIAGRAGVATPTVYAVFGNKTGLLRALLDELEDDADAREWHARLAGAASDDRPALIAAWSRTLYERGHDVIRATYAAGTDGDAAALHAEGDRRRRAMLAELVDDVDRAFVLTAPTLYLDCVDKCGWSAGAYEAWLAALLAAEVRHE